MMESESLLIKVVPLDVFYFNKIIESMDNIGVVTIIKGKEGIIEIKSPFSNREELLDLLNNIGKKYELITEQENK